MNTADGFLGDGILITASRGLARVYDEAELPDNSSIISDSHWTIRTVEDIYNALPVFSWIGDSVENLEPFSISVHQPRSPQDGRAHILDSTDL
jgi:hypothetical protein